MNFLKTVNIYDNQTGELLAFYKELDQFKLALIAKHSYVVNEAGELLTRVEII